VSSGATTGCLGIIPGTFIICGETTQYCSDTCWALKSPETWAKRQRPKSETWWIGANVAAVLCAFFRAEPQTDAQRLQLVRQVQCPPDLIEYGDALCVHCGHEIDSQVCHCGESEKFHFSEHSFVPVGCTCGYYDAEQRTVLAQAAKERR